MLTPHTIIPLHTSHKLQPLDGEDFGPFKIYYNEACNWHLTNAGQPVKVYDVASVAGIAYPMAFTPKNITSRFSSCGICPINSNIFRDDDFYGSYATYITDPALTDDLPQIHQTVKSREK